MSHVQSALDKAYEDELLRSWDNPDIQINHIIEKERKVSMKDVPKFHSQENHDYWEARLGKGNCFYCDNGIPIKEEEKP